VSINDLADPATPKRIPDTSKKYQLCASAKKSSRLF